MTDQYAAELETRWLAYVAAYADAYDAYFDAAAYEAYDAYADAYDDALAAARATYDAVCKEMY